mmetsp:Transcript_7157/g.9923  ORF Transcript_7157/g.9923 Transcript_7157/m.9923 type:complete len:554 (-) Transcript_7157:83-1744(-)
MEKALEVVIIGGVAAGATAATKIRRESETANITIFEKGPYVSFANCGLPYFVGGQIEQSSSLILQTPDSLWKRYRIKVNLRHEVLSIDRTKKVVSVKNLDTNAVSEVPFDKLLISPGSSAIVPPLPGINSKNIFVVKTVPDVQNIKNFINTTKPTKAVVIGGGFIGLETAESLFRQKMDVTIVELMPQLLPPFDPDMALFMEHHIQQHGIKTILNDGVKSFITNPEDFATQVELNSGKKIDCDLVILSIGVRCEVKLAKDCGLTIGVTGGIQVNPFQQTSDPDIYAAGDAVETKNLITGKPAKFALAGPANKQGRVAGFNIVRGNKLEYPGAIGTSIVSCMEAVAAMTGLSEKACKQEGIPYQVAVVHPLDHVGYYPGSHALHIKLMSHKETGRILGAEIIGEHGVDKRIDVLATAITGKMTVYDLEHLDLAYAPQYGAAQDPVVMAAFSTADALRGEVQTISYQDLLKIKDTVQLVDVRTPSEYQSGHVDGAILLPVDEIRNNLSKLDPKKETVVYCRVGMRGYIAARILTQCGFTNVKNMLGGYVSVAANV